MRYKQRGTSGAVSCIRMNLRQQWRELNPWQSRYDLEADRGRGSPSSRERSALADLERFSGTFEQFEHLVNLLDVV